MYEEALNKAKEKDLPHLTHHEIKKQNFQQKTIPPFWEQYISETSDGYILTQNLGSTPIMDLKLTKKHKKHIKECLALIGLEKYYLDEQVQLSQLYNIVMVCILDCLTLRQLGEETLAQQTGTRHALILEVVNQIEKIYVYRQKKLNKDQKKTYVLMTLAILEKLVEIKLIKQETITIRSGDFVNIADETEMYNEIDTTIPYINDKAANELRTIYIYSTLQDLRLPLTLNYGNISVIPLTQYIDEDHIIYHQGATLKSIQKATLENKHSARHIILENITVINRLKELQLFINPQLYALVKQNIDNDKNLNTKTILQEIRRNIQQLKVPIYKSQDKTDGAQDKVKKGRINKFATQKKVKTLQKKINKQLILLDFIMLEQFPELLQRPIYFYFIFDFRGRLYFKSKISPQNNYLFRYIYDYGQKTTQILEPSLGLPLDYEKGSNVILQSVGQNVNLRIAERRILVGLVIEFAKLQKSAYIDIYKGCFSLENLIQIGLQTLFQEKLDGADVEKQVQFNYIKFLGRELFEKQGLSRHYIIYKDATASAIQLLTILLGPANTEIAIRANLLSTSYGYDTYYYIIQLFKQKHKLSEESICYFTRNNLKKTIMTYNYAATFYTCGQEFEMQLHDQNTEITTAQLQKIKYDFKTFYQYLDDLFNKQSIFLKSLEGITQNLLDTYKGNKQITIRSVDNATIHLHYLVSATKRGSVQAHYIRKTIQMQELQEKLDIKKTRQALKPNTTHAMDAALIRETMVELRKPIITIHDCYGMDIFEIDATIYSINNNINRIATKSDAAEQKQGFSLFIVL